MTKYACYTAKDISTILDMPQRTVQRYTDIGIIKPSISYPTGTGKTRYYSSNDMQLFFVAKVLKCVGFRPELIGIIIDKYTCENPTEQIEHPELHHGIYERCVG